MMTTETSARELSWNSTKRDIMLHFIGKMRIPLNLSVWFLPRVSLDKVFLIFFHALLNTL